MCEPLNHTHKLFINERYIIINTVKLITEQLSIVLNLKVT